MTYLTKDVADQLLASAAIVDVVSDRVYPDRVPQGVAYPAIVISDLSNDPEYILTGEAGVHTSIVSIDGWTDGRGGRASINDLSELIRNRLSGYSGTLGTGVTAHSCRMIRNNTLAADPLQGSDQHRRRASLDFEIIHSAAVPTLA